MTAPGDLSAVVGLLHALLVDVDADVTHWQGRLDREGGWDVAAAAAGALLALLAPRRLGRGDPAVVAALVADARREYEVGPEVDADRAEQLLAGVLGMGELPVDRDAHDIDMLFLLLAKLTYDLRLSDAEFTAVAVEAETQAVRVLRRIATGDAT